MHLHILGICGTFMAGLALLARQLGHSVSGSDTQVYPPMSTQLHAAGIDVQEGYLAEHLQPAPDLVVVGNAMTRGNPAVEYLLNSSITYTSGPQWLADHVLPQRWPIAVAGTHGKTTTSAMLAWILDWAGLSPGFVIGGLPNDFNVSARLGESAFFVIEADEYDSAFFDKRSKFIHYRPRTLILNNLEFDHADIFDDLAAIQRQFHHLVRTVPSEGLIISPGDDPHLAQVLAMGCWTEVASMIKGDWQIHHAVADGSSFEIYWRDQCQGQVTWSQLGEHNQRNGLAALLAARHVGVPIAQGIEALAQFSGVKRRLEIRGQVAGITVYDDFAHHPTAIASTLAGLRARLGQARIIAVLELRSNTMRQGIFNQQLASALAAADQAVIYQDAQLDFDLRALNLGQVYQHVDHIVADLVANTRSGDHILVMSNGGFQAIHDKLLAALAEHAA